MVHLFGIQDDILDEKSGQLSFANSGPCCVATVGYILTDPDGVATPAHSRDLDFRVEAKGLEPSNLLTASQK
jgi:hypothetical protein